MICRMNCVGNQTRRCQMNAIVRNDANWVETVDYDRLKGIQTVALGNRHNPVNHGDALDMFKTILDKNGVPILKERGMLSNDGLKYIYVADVYSAEDDYVLTNGFMNYNNRAKAFTIIMGERVFVCSNECVSNQLKDLRRRHTINAFDSIREKIQIGVDRFESFSQKRIEEINKMKEIAFTEQMLGKAVLEFHRDGRFSNTDIDRIINEYDNPSYEEFVDPTAWNFHNACTHVFKRVANPMRRIEFQQTMKTIVDNVIETTATAA